MSAVAKLGRNEPCPCGSRKKYKKCCGSATASPAPPNHPFTIRQVSFDEVPESVKIAFFKQQREEAERVKKFGHVRPPIAVDHHGYKLVAVGSKLMWAKEWKAFHDFLFTYIAGVLGKECWPR